MKYHHSGLSRKIAMDCESVHFCYIPLANGQKLFVQSEWKSTGTNLLLINDEASPKCAWKGFLAKWEIESKARDLEVPTEEFFCTTRKALTTAADKFLYDFTDDNEFTWTKVEDVKILYGSVKMTKLTEIPEHDVRRTLVELLDELRKQLSTKSSQVNDLQQINEICIKEHSDYVENRNEWESTMMSNMAAVLNAKKLHIANLEDHLKVNASIQDISMQIDGVELTQRSQKNSEDSSSQEINLAALPKRQKVAAAAAERPTTRLQMRSRNTTSLLQKSQPEEPSGSNCYDKDTLDLDLIN